MAATVMRAPAPRFLPVLPTLGPGSLVAPLLPGGREAPFPFSERGARRYYFARNGVFEAAGALGLSGAEVLVPAYHHGVEVEALEAAGAVPRFVRVDREMRLDLEHLERSIARRTRAIYVIHYLGFPQPMEEILRIGRAHGLPVVEDCALALLSRDGDVPLGSQGDVGIFCLYKTLPVPNGGMLVANRPLGLDRELRPAPLGSTLSHAAGSFLAHLALRYGERGVAVREAVRQTGRKVRSATGATALSTGTTHFDPASADVAMSPMTELVLRGLPFDAIVEARRRNWSVLSSRLSDLAPPVQDELPAGACPLFYPLVCEDKDRVGTLLAEQGIETVDFWRDGHPACRREEFPEVDALRRTVLELPLHQDLTSDDMSWLATAVERVIR